MSVFDPNPNVRSLDRGANNVIMSAAASTVGFAFTQPNLPASSIAYGRTTKAVAGAMPPNMEFQVTSTGGATITGQFIGSNDLVNWYQIGSFNGDGLYAIAGVTPRYISASLDSLVGGTAPTVTVSVV